MRAYARAFIALAGVLAGVSPAGAQSPDPAAAQALRAEIEQLRKDFDARMSALEARLAALEGAPPPSAAAAQPAAPQPGGVGAAPPPPPTAEVPAGAQGAGGPSGVLPIYGNVSAASKIFNPDIAVIGNFLGAGGSNDVAPEPSFAMREAEASFQAIVDPFARADFFMAFGEEGVDLEEGFVTFPTLPLGLLAKAGKMRASFGRVNTWHTHQSPWPDRPLMTVNLLGGEEGIADAGVSVSKLIPNPLLFLEATGQVFRGDAGELFAASRRRDVSYLGRLRAYQDITESTNLDVGASYMRGRTAQGLLLAGEQDEQLVFDPDSSTTLFGFDAAVRWRPLRRSIYRSFVGRAEAAWSRREQSGGRLDAMGWFVSGDYQFARRWFVGARLDSSGRLLDPSLRDKGGSVLLTFWPSEFSQLRGQYRRTKYADAPIANELLVQLQFSIGAHGAHVF